MLFICYPKCSTCQKARAFLENKGVMFQERHIVEAVPTIDELKKWLPLTGKPLKSLFNTSGLVYRGLGLSEKLSAMSEEEQFRLLASNGMLIKRPLLVDEKRVLVGFKEKEWNASFIK